MTALKYWIWLSCAHVSPKTKAKLIDYYGDAETAFFAPDGDFSEIAGINQTEAEILERRDCTMTADIISECREQGINIISMQDSAYPQRLRNIYAPPAVIYVKGRLPELDGNAPIAVIGTRKASTYGLKMSRDMAYEIAQCGGIVVSLVGSSIDAAAAKAAMLAGGCCVGVLGTAHEAESSRLAEQICENGALISEYPPRSVQYKSNFRDRNRIAAGISVGVVVIEAPEKSGTRLFVDEAIEQGKEIFALPGNADSKNSAGTLAMIKEGGRLVTRGREVMSEFKALYPDRITLDVKFRAPEEEESIKSANKSAVTAKKSIDKEMGKGYIDWKEQLASLSEVQLKIIAAIDAEATHIDDIIESTGLSTATVLAQLTVLEIKGFVRREAGRRISLKTAKK